MRLPVFTVCLLINGLMAGANASVVIYPAPAGADMASGVTITANGQPVPVYAFPSIDPVIGAGRFSQFSFSDSVTITVSPVSAGTVLRPAFAKLSPTISGGTLTVTLRKPMNLHVVGVAYIFANGIEVDPPKQGDPGVVYYGPGVSSTPISISSNQTLYLAGGAWVNSGLNLSNVNNVKVMGRGILVGTIRTNTCDNVLVTGIVQVNKGEHTWSGRITNSSNFKFINFKEVGAAGYSTDGTNLVNSSNVLYDSCSWCCNDDNIAIKGMGPSGYCHMNPNGGLPNENIIIQNCMFWNCNNNCNVTMGAETYTARYRNITIRNCDMWHSGGDGGGAISIQCLHGTHFSNLVFDNCTVNEFSQFVKFYFSENIMGICGDQSWPGGVDSVRFSNFSVTGSGNKAIILQGWDANKKIKNVAFSNINIDGKCVTSTSDSHFQLNQYTENITVTGCNAVPVAAPLPRAVQIGHQGSRLTVRYMPGHSIAGIVAVVPQATLSDEAGALIYDVRGRLLRKSSRLDVLKPWGRF